MKRWLGLVLLLLALPLIGMALESAQDMAAPESADEPTAIEGVWDEIFAAMQARDGDAALQLIGVETPIVRVADDGTVGRSTGGDFAAALRAMEFEPRESVTGAVEIDIDGGLATARVPYAFHQGETYSHCGVNHFSFARGAAGWRLVAVVYSVHPTCDAAGRPTAP
jgi:hypothetical protein